MKKFLYTLLFLLLIVLGVTFTIQNPQEVFVRYYFGLSWSGPLVLLLLATLITGILFGAFVGFFRNLLLRRRYARRLKVQMVSANKQSPRELMTTTRH